MFHNRSPSDVCPLSGDKVQVIAIQLFLIFKRVNAKHSPVIERKTPNKQVLD